MKKTVFLSIVACSFLYSAEPMNKSLLKNRANYAEDNGGVYGNKMYIYKDAVETQREINEQIRSGSRNIEIASPTIDRNSKVRGVETLVEGGNLNIIGRNADVNIASPKIAPNSGVKEINTAVNLNNINLLANTNNTVNIAAPTVSGANPLTVINTNVNLGSLNTAANQNMTANIGSATIDSITSVKSLSTNVTVSGAVKVNSGSTVNVGGINVGKQQNKNTDAKQTANTNAVYEGGQLSNLSVPTNVNTSGSKSGMAYMGEGTTVNSGVPMDSGSNGFSKWDNFEKATAGVGVGGVGYLVEGVGDLSDMGISAYEWVRGKKSSSKGAIKKLGTSIKNKGVYILTDAATEYANNEYSTDLTVDQASLDEATKTMDTAYFAADMVTGVKGIVDISKAGVKTYKGYKASKKGEQAVEETIQSLNKNVTNETASVSATQKAKKLVDNIKNTHSFVKADDKIGDASKIMHLDVLSETAAVLEEIKKTLGVEVELLYRKANETQIKWITMNFPMKPESIKAKTMKEVDYYLNPAGYSKGANQTHWEADNLGKVGLFRPSKISDKMISDYAETVLKKRPKKDGTPWSNEEAMQEAKNKLEDAYKKKIKDFETTMSDKNKWMKGVKDSDGTYYTFRRDDKTGTMRKLESDENGIPLKVQKNTPKEVVGDYDLAEMINKETGKPLTEDKKKIVYNELRKKGLVEHREYLEWETERTKDLDAILAMQRSATGKKWSDKKKKYEEIEPDIFSINKDKEISYYRLQNNQSEYDRKEQLKSLLKN